MNMINLLKPSVSLTEYNEMIKNEKVDTNFMATKQADRAISAVVAILLGTFFVFGIGFSHSNVIHNAAHDSRHSAGFPCH